MKYSASSKEGRKREKKDRTNWKEIARQQTNTYQLISLNTSNSLKDRFSNKIKSKTQLHAILYDSYFKQKSKGRLKIKGWEKICHANCNQKKAEWLY